MPSDDLESQTREMFDYADKLVECHFCNTNTGQFHYWPMVVTKTNAKMDVFACDRCYKYLKSEMMKMLLRKI